MKLKIFKKIICILCAACISTSVATASVGAITTTNENPEWQEKIHNINSRLSMLKGQIQIYRGRLNGRSVGDNSEESVVKIARASELLYQVEEMIKKLENLNLNNEETFNLEAFKNNLSAFENYMRNYALYGKIDLDTIIEKIVGREGDDEDNGINIAYWNERIDETINNNNINDINNNIININNNIININNNNNINNNINNINNNNNNNNNINNNDHDNGLIQNILQRFENSNENLNNKLDEAVQMINASNFHSPAKKAEACLKILNKLNHYNEDHYKKFENILQNYVDSYIVNSLNDKLRFIDNFFQSKNTLMTSFNNFFRNVPFVIVVRTEIMNEIKHHSLSTIKYEKIDNPGISDANKLNRFIDRTLIKNMSTSGDAHNGLLKSLSKIFKFKGMIDYLQIRTIAADRLYNEDDLNFTAKQLPKCVEYFQKLIRKLTDTYIRNLSDILNLSDQEFENEYPNNADDERIKATRVARRLGAPIIELMEPAVTNKLGDNNLAFDDGERQNIEDIFARLNQNIEFLCSRIRIRQIDDDTLEMRYLHENLNNNLIDVDNDAPQNDVNVNDNGWFEGLNLNNNINNENNNNINDQEHYKQLAFTVGHENAIRFRNKEGFNVEELDEQYLRGFDEGLNDLKNKNLKELLEITFDDEYPIKENISVMYKILDLRKNDEYKQKAEAVLNVLNRINDLENRKEFGPALSDIITSYIDMYLKELEGDIKSGKVDEKYIGMSKDIQSQKNKIVTMASNAIENSYLPNRFDSFDKFEAFMYGQLSFFMPRIWS